VVGQSEIEPAVVINIYENGSQAIVPPGVSDSGFFAHVRERSISIVVEEMIGLSCQAQRTADGADSPKLARRGRKATLAAYRRMRWVEFHVSRHEQVQQTVIVVVTPGRAGGTAPRCDAWL